jgi:hypothetical protein
MRWNGEIEVCREEVEVTVVVCIVQYSMGKTCGGG